MKDSDEYDAQALPVSGPFAGLDPEQLPVIVDKQGQRVSEHVSEASAIPDYVIVAALAELCRTHCVQIELGGAKPVHRIVLGDGDFREQLARSLEAALAHHAMA